MITESTIYWVTRMDELKALFKTSAGFCLVIGILLTAVMVIVRVGAASGEKDSIELLKNRLLMWVGPALLSAALLFGLCGSLTPSTRDYCLIKAIPAVVNSEDVSQKARDASELIDLFMARAKEELKRSTNAEQEK